MTVRSALLLIASLSVLGCRGEKKATPAPAPSPVAAPAAPSGEAPSAPARPTVVPEAMPPAPSTAPVPISTRAHPIYLPAEGCGRCEPGSVCVYRTVQCVKAPCPPVPECQPCSPACSSSETCVAMPSPCEQPPCPSAARCVGKQ